MEHETFQIRVHRRGRGFHGLRAPIDRKALMDRIAAGNHGPRGGFGRGGFGRGRGRGGPRRGGHGPGGFGPGGFGPGGFGPGGPHPGGHGHGPGGPHPCAEGLTEDQKKSDVQANQSATAATLSASDVAALESDTTERTDSGGAPTAKNAGETDFVKISKADLDLLLGEDTEEDEEEVDLKVSACTLEDSAKNYVSEYLAENFETSNPSSSIIGMLEGLNSKFGKGWLLEISTDKDFDKKKVAPRTLFMFGLGDDTKRYAIFKVKS